MLMETSQMGKRSSIEISIHWATQSAIASKGSRPIKCYRVKDLRTSNPGVSRSHLSGHAKQHRSHGPISTHRFSMHRNLPFVVQSNFRAELKFKMDSRHPDPDKDLLWCPGTGLYRAAQMVVAGHLFPWKSGQDIMDVTFGRPEDSASELLKLRTVFCGQRESKRDSKPDTS